MGLRSRPKSGRKYDGSKQVVDNNQIKSVIREPMDVPPFIEDTPGPQISPKPTPSITPTNTPTPSITPSNTPTKTVTKTPTKTPTQTPSNTITKTPTRTANETPPPTKTPTSTKTQTPSNTATPSNTPSNTQTPSNTRTPTNTPSQTGTPDPSKDPTNTPTPTPSITPSNTPTPSITPSNTPTPTATKTQTPTTTPTQTETPSNTPTQTQTATSTGTPTNTKTPTQTPSNTSTPGSTPTPTRTSTGTPDPSKSSTPTHTSTNTQTPTRTPDGTQTATPTPTVSTSLSPSTTATKTQTPTPTRTPATCRCWRIENTSWKVTPAVQISYYNLDCKGVGAWRLTGTQVEAGSSSIIGIQYTYICGSTPNVPDPRGIVLLLGDCGSGASCPEVEPPAPLSVECDSTNVSTFGGNDGQVNLIINGGTPPYTITYLGNTITLPFTGLVAGTYSFVVSDSTENFPIECEVSQPPCTPPGGLTLINLTGRWWDNVNQTGTLTNIGNLNYTNSCQSYLNYSEDVTVSIQTGETYVSSFTVGGTLYSSPSACNCNALPFTSFWVNLVSTSASVNQTDGVYYVSVDKATCQITQLSACTVSPPGPPACNNCGMAGISFSDGLNACPPIDPLLTISQINNNIIFDNQIGNSSYQIFNTSGLFLSDLGKNSRITIQASKFVPSNIIKLIGSGSNNSGCEYCFTLAGTPTPCP